MNHLESLPEPGSNIRHLPVNRGQDKEQPAEGSSAQILSFPNRRPTASEPICEVEQVIAALAANRVDVVYQPQLDLRSGEIRGVEALARLSDERGHLLDTGRVFALAERHDFVGVLGRRSVERAVLGFVESELYRAETVTLAINASPKELEDPGYAVWLLSLLKDAGLEAGRVELELTENTQINVSGCQIEHLNRLHEAGVAIAVDDFGTGLANWQRVIALPVSMIKLDASFAAQVATHDSVRKLVRHLTAVARDLNFELLAEGIETEAQLTAFQEAGCHFGQGFGLGRPAPLSSLQFRQHSP